MRYLPSIVSAAVLATVCTLSAHAQAMPCKGLIKVSAVNWNSFDPSHKPPLYSYGALLSNIGNKRGVKLVITPVGFQVGDEGIETVRVRNTYLSANQGNFTESFMTAPLFPSLKTFPFAYDDEPIPGGRGVRIHGCVKQ